MMLSHLHATHRAGNHALVGARIRQFLKATEQTVNSGASWETSWLAAGLPDPRPRRRIFGGLTHPAEAAAQVAHFLELAHLEEARKKAEDAAPKSDG